MELARRKSNWLLMLIIAFYISSSQASRDDEVRILIVGTRGQSRFRAADLLSGEKGGGQEDREIVKTPVITNEGRKMMLVTGPNLCDEDTATQIFTTALFLSSPGPHAVLMVLNLEDQQSQQCDIVKRAQELLGAEVLQYCIVLLLQNHQEHLTGASREMINACVGRVHVIRDSEPKPAQTAALIAEIDKIVLFNADRFYSALTETQQLEVESLEHLERQKLFQENENVNEENNLLSVRNTGLWEAVGIVGWISLSALVIYSKLRHKSLHFEVKFAALGLFMINFRNVLHPDISIPLNFALVSILVTVRSQDTRLDLGGFIGFFVMLPLGTIVSVRTWSDVLIACYAASGVTIGAFALTFYKEDISRKSPVFELFLYCSVGATLSVGFLNVLGVKMTIIILILGFAMACLCLKNETRQNVMSFLFFIVVLPCVCVFIGSVFLILGLVMSFLKVIMENLLNSYLLYVALLFGSLKVICQRQPALD